MIAQLAMLSLVAVFKDVCPGYRIRLPTEKELQTQVRTSDSMEAVRVEPRNPTDDGCHARCAFIAATSHNYNRGWLRKRAGSLCF